MRKGRDREISRRASIRLSRSAKAPITCVHNVEILTCFGWMATRFNSARRAPVRTTTCGSERGRGVERGGRRGQIRETTTLCFTLRTSCGVHEAVPLVLEFSGTSSVRTSDSSSAFDSRFRWNSTDVAPFEGKRENSSRFWTSLMVSRIRVSIQFVDSGCDFIWERYNKTIYVWTNETR